MNEYSQHVLDKLRALKPAFKDMGLKRVRVYGSMARGEAGKNSDIDLLIDFEGTPTLFDVMDVQERIARDLNLEVDLATPGALHPALKDKILNEAIDV